MSSELKNNPRRKETETTSIGRTCYTSHQKISRVFFDRIAKVRIQLDWSCAYKAKAGILQNETVWANATKMPSEAWYEMYVKPWHPELAMVGMRVLSQVISASSCERNWSAHGHIHSKIRNRLEPATTEKLVYVYSNSKMAAATRDADELKMFAWDNEDD